MGINDIIPGVNPVMAIAMLVLVGGVMAFSVASLFLRGHKGKRKADKNHSGEAHA